MKARAKSRAGFGFDLIVGFLLLVIPTTAGIIMLFIDIWGVMRMDNNVKLLNFQVTRNLANLVKYSDYDASKISALGSTVCLDGKTLQLSGEVQENSDGFIESTIIVDYEGDLLGKKELKHTLVVTSYNDLNGTVTFRCQ